MTGLRSSARAVVVVAIAALLAACSAQRVLEDDPAFVARAKAVDEQWRSSGLAARWATSVIPLGSPTLEPAESYPTDKLNVAMSLGLLRTAVDLPGVPEEGTVTYADGAAVRVPLLSAQAAFAAMQPAEATRQCFDSVITPNYCESFTVTGAALRTDRIQTSHGVATAPVWHFSVRGRPAGIDYVAVDPRPVTDLLTSIRLGPNDPDLRASSELISVEGSTVTYKVEVRECDRNPSGLVWESQAIVVVGGVSRPPCNGLETAAAEVKRFTVTTKAPVGDRPIVDAMSGRPLFSPGLTLPASH